MQFTTGEGPRHVQLDAKQDVDLARKALKVAGHDRTDLTAGGDFPKVLSLGESELVLSGLEIATGVESDQVMDVINSDSYPKIMRAVFNVSDLNK